MPGEEEVVLSEAVEQLRAQAHVVQVALRGASNKSAESAPRQPRRKAESDYLDLQMLS